MRTEFKVEYDLYDTTALQDAQESSDSNSSFADITLIKNNITAPSYGTLEHNFFVLDGSKEEFPDTPDNIVYFSEEFIQQNNNYAYCGTEIYAGDDLDAPIEKIYKKQSVIVNFSENHTSYGITLYFSNEYPLEIEIIWYDLAGTKKSQKRFYPNSLKYFCQNQVEEYGKIEIIFLKALPYHNAKLQYIEYGTTIEWGSDKVKSGKLVNGVDMISDKISTDQLTFDFVDSNNDFNVGNVDGLHKTFQKKQKMCPYEIVDGTKIPLGTFFLNSNKTTKNISKIVAIDYKGILANSNFTEGRIYDGDLAGEIIDEIMQTAGITEYEVDEETANTPLYGTLKIQTCQKALREVLFACGSIINTSRRKGIEIYKSNRLISEKITRSKKFSTTFQIDDYISDINVKYKTWSLDENVSQITKGTYGVGIHTIQFTDPAANITTNAGLILKQMPYYIVLKMSDEADVEISGQKYVGAELSVLSSIEHIKAGETRKAKTFTGTLLNFESAKKVADNILDYYQLQQIIQTKQIAGTEKAGDWIEVENVVKEHGNFVAVIETLSTDLTGGFINTAKYRGYYKLLSNYYYADSELYADEEMGGIF